MGSMPGEAATLDPRGLLSSTAETPILFEPVDDLIDLDPLSSEGEERDEGEPIVVVGKRLQDEAPASTAGTGSMTGYRRGDFFFTTGEQPVDADTPPTVTTIDPPADEAAIEIKVNVDPLTPEQAVVVQKFVASVKTALAAIKALDDDQKIRMNDGRVITGAELKDIVSRLDFVINPTGYDGYNNKEARGEAAWKNGNPQISLNMDVIERYSLWGDRGTNFLVLHEMGHLTSANRNADWDGRIPQSLIEVMASDIARAIAYEAKLELMPATGEVKYSTPDPIPFEWPNDEGGDGDGEGGGDGGGWQVDQPI